MKRKFTIRLIALMVLMAIAIFCPVALADNTTEVIEDIAIEVQELSASEVSQEAVENESAVPVPEAAQAKPLPGEEMEVADDVLLPGARPRAEKEDVINILLIGTDERTKNFSENARGDTCMLFSINKREGSIRIISFERALGIPMHEGPYKGKTDWLTHLFRYGGAELMKNELSRNFDLNIDGYVRVNIRTFVALIDAIGGIDMELTSAECKYINGSGNYSAREIGAGKDVIRVKKGLNHLNGATAMVYARCRKIDSDWGRVVRQRKVIVAAMKQLSQSDLGSLVKVVFEMLPMVQTDITAAQVADLVGLLQQFINAETTEMTVPSKGKYSSRKGMGGRSVYSVNFDSYSKELDTFLYG